MTLNGITMERAVHPSGLSPRAGEDATDVLVPLQLNKYYNNVLDSYDLDVEEQLNPQLRFHQVHSQQ